MNIYSLPLADQQVNKLIRGVQVPIPGVLAWCIDPVANLRGFKQKRQKLQIKTTDQLGKGQNPTIYISIDWS